MRSHSVTFYPTQVGTLHTCHTGRYSIYLPRRDGRLSWPRWLVTYRDGLHARRRSPIQVLTGPKPGPMSINLVDRTQRANHYTTPPPMLQHLFHRPTTDLPVTVTHSATLLPSDRRHLSCGDDCLEDKSEDYQNCSVLYYVPQLYTVMSTHKWAVLTGVLWPGLSRSNRGPVTIQYNTMRVFSAPYTEKQTGRHPALCTLGLGLLNPPSLNGW